MNAEKDEGQLQIVLPVFDAETTRFFDAIKAERKAVLLKWLEQWAPENGPH